MPGCIMKFSPISVTHFKYSFIPGGHHHLFIKLRTLGQKNPFIKVLDRKHFGPTFGALRHNLWCVNFGESVFPIKIPKTLDNLLLDMENRMNHWVPEAQYSVIQSPLNSCL